MTKTSAQLMACLLAVGLAGCTPEQPAAGPDPAALKRAVQQKTERMLWIHLRLETAADEIARAQAAAGEGNTSAAEFHAREAYRNVAAADEAVLELGQQLQQMVNLDIAD